MCKKANIGKIVISTDSKIRNLSLNYGAEYVRLRPKKYSTSKSTIISVILDYLRNEIKKKILYQKI
jgi:CMP-N-acetylneuraminic acid synthetase